jgi:hypothetical protein
MPDIPHEAVVEILQNEPSLVAVLLDGVGVHLPAEAVPIRADTNLSVRDPRLSKQLIADNVFVFSSLRHRVAVVVEVQSGRPGRGRKFAWPAYACVARSREKYAVLFLVIALTREAAAGSSQTIRTGHPGLDLRPFVCGPGGLPGPGGPAFAPELVVLNVLTGNLDLTMHEARVLAIAIINGAPRERAGSYTRIIWAVAPESARKPLEKLMKTIKVPFLDEMIAEGIAEGRAQGVAQGVAQGRAQGVAEGRAQGVAEGRAQGEARLLLRVMAARGIAVPEETRAWLEECQDTARLEELADRAVSARTLAEIFADQPKPPGMK